MKMHRNFTTVGIFLLFAAEMVIFNPKTVRAQEKIRTLTTGVSTEDRQAHPDYSLKLVFTSRDEKAYLADVTVMIYKDNEELVNEVSEGPWFFVDLEPGTYWVIAETDNGMRQSAQINIESDQQQEVYLTWPMKNKAMTDR